MHAKFIDSLTLLFKRDLEKLEQEISLYPDEAALWQISGAIKNSGANLALHLCGNLQHYVGHVLGGSGYRRNRDLEFSARNLPRKEIIETIAGTREVVLKTIPTLTPDRLEAEYPEKVFDYGMNTQHFLIHLLAHLGYHLGQINYHRRITAGA